MGQLDGALVHDPAVAQLVDDAGLEKHRAISSGWIPNYGLKNRNRQENILIQLDSIFPSYVT